MIWDKCQALACSMPAKTHDEENKEERGGREEESQGKRNAGTKGREGREQQGTSMKK